MNAERVSADPRDAIDLVAISRIIWRRKYLVALGAFLGACVAIAIAFAMTPTFRAEVVVTEVREKGMGGAGRSLVNQFGSLASLAGVNLSGGDGSQESKGVLRSRRLAEEFVNRNNLTKEFSGKDGAAPTLWAATNEFRGSCLKIKEDSRTGIITVVIDYKDSATAAKWANSYVALANELLRVRALDESTRNINYLKAQIGRTDVVGLQQAMYSLVEAEMKTLMLASAREEYAFTIIDPAVQPEIRFSPQRTLIVLSGFVVGMILAMVFVTVRHYWKTRLVSDVRAAST